MADLDYVEAKDLIEAARAHGLAYIDAVKALWTGRAWLAMEYPSWDALVREELGDLPRLNGPMRREVVADLAATGMSSRAIAPVVGAGHVTVTRDLATVPNETVTGLDGRTTRPARQRRSVQLPTEDRANHDITTWLPTLRSFNEDFAGTRLMATLAVTGDTRVELVRMLQALQHNINQVLSVIDFTREETP